MAQLSRYFFLNFIALLTRLVLIFGLRLFWLIVLLYIKFYWGLHCSLLTRQVVLLNEDVNNAVFVSLGCLLKVVLNHYIFLA